MKKLFKGIKLLFASICLAYSGIIIYQLYFASKEKRYHLAANRQGREISQTTFNILAKQYPEDADIYFEQSIPFNKRGDYAKGFELLNKAVALNPEVHIGYRGYMKLRFLRDYKGALKDFKTLDSLFPKTDNAAWGEDVNFLRGECYLGLKDYKTAIQSFNKAINSAGEGWADIQNFVYLGICYYNLQQYEEAEVNYQRAINQFENTCEAYYGMATVCLKTGEVNKGIEYINKAEENLAYKRNDHYKEFLNEVYLNDIIKLKQALLKMKGTLVVHKN